MDIYKSTMMLMKFRDITLIHEMCVCRKMNILSGNAGLLEEGGRFSESCKGGDVARVW